jgi:hypothetical protein
LGDQLRLAGLDQDIGRASKGGMTRPIAQLKKTGSA